MKPSVLLVEDDQELCLELATYLASSGFQVRSAGTLDAACTALAQAPNLIVLDINLPDGSGLELFRQVHSCQRIGIVMCTGRDELLSRSGSNCKVSGFRQIVEVGD